ncbi:MAG TPA: ATPase [Firmicutes bacterium]|nr:ATPase [Bacillota bacterium]
MNVEELLDQLDEVIDKGLGLGSRRCIVDAEKIRILIDDIRLNMPQEIKQARSIVSDRADIITTAKREAEGIIHQAEEKAKTLVAQEEITRQAQARAADIIAQSQQKSREMRKAAQEFVDDIMRRADEGLTMNLSEVRKVRASLKQQIPPAGRNEQ